MRTDYPDDSSADAIIIDEPGPKRIAAEAEASCFLIDHGHSILISQLMIGESLASNQRKAKFIEIAL